MQDPLCGERVEPGGQKDGSTNDNMTGLDIDGLDVVVSVGGGNFVQRTGRLCRYSSTKPSAKKHPWHVEMCLASCSKC